MIDDGLMLFRPLGSHSRVECKRAEIDLRTFLIGKGKRILKLRDLLFSTRLAKVRSWTVTIQVSIVQLMGLLRKRRLLVRDIAVKV